MSRRNRHFHYWTRTLVAYGVPVPAVTGQTGRCRCVGEIFSRTATAAGEIARDVTRPVFIIDRRRLHSDNGRRLSDLFLRENWTLYPIDNEISNLFDLFPVTTTRSIVTSPPPRRKKVPVVITTCFHRIGRRRRRWRPVAVTLSSFFYYPSRPPPPAVRTFGRPISPDVYIITPPPTIHPLLVSDNRRLACRRPATVHVYPAHVSPVRRPPPHRRTRRSRLSTGK